MQVVFESAINRDATERLEAIVKRSLADRRLPEGARVYISRPRSGWSVFVFGVEEHPLHLAERIRAALLREAPEQSARHAPLRRLREV
jgi:hypothetical protein